MRHYNISYPVLRGLRWIPYPETLSGVDPCKIPYADYPELAFYEVG